MFGLGLLGSQEYSALALGFLVHKGAQWSPTEVSSLVLALESTFGGFLGSLSFLGKEAPCFCWQVLLWMT